MEQLSKPSQPVTTFLSVLLISSSPFLHRKKKNPFHRYDTRSCLTFIVKTTDCYCIGQNIARSLKFSPICNSNCFHKRQAIASNSMIPVQYSSSPTGLCLYSTVANLGIRRTKGFSRCPPPPRHGNMAGRISLINLPNETYCTVCTVPGGLG